MTTAVEWHHTARTACTAHTWITGWHTGGVEAILTDALQAGWECLLIESTSGRPLSHTTRAAVLAAGVTIIGPDPRDIHAALTTVDEVLHRRLNRPRAERPTIDQRPLLILVSIGNHIHNDVLQRVVALGRAADVHLAVDERARRRTPITFNDNVLAVYHGSRPRRRWLHSLRLGGRLRERRPRRR